MARSSLDVASEFIQLVVASGHDMEQCTKLLAARLDKIYDFAYARGIEAGKQTAKATAPQSSASQPQPTAAPAPSSAAPAPRPKHRLYGLPCTACGTFFADDQCPVCEARARDHANDLLGTVQKVTVSHAVIGVTKEAEAKPAETKTAAKSAEAKPGEGLSEVVAIESKHRSTFVQPTCSA